MANIFYLTTLHLFILPRPSTLYATYKHYVTSNYVMCAKVFLIYILYAIILLLITFTLLCEDYTETSMMTGHEITWQKFAHPKSKA